MIEFYTDLILFIVFIIREGYMYNVYNTTLIFYSLRMESSSYYQCHFVDQMILVLGV